MYFVTVDYNRECDWILWDEYRGHFHLFSPSDPYINALTSLSQLDFSVWLTHKENDECFLLTGFRRPIQLFTKPDTSVNSPNPVVLVPEVDNAELAVDMPSVEKGVSSGAEVQEDKW